MNSARVFAVLFVAAFFGAGYVPDGWMRTALGFVLVVGVVAIVAGVLRPARRR